MKTMVIIPAGGAGKRMGAERSKQYLLLADVPVVVHTLRIFQNSESVDGIILVVPKEDIPSVRTEIVDRYAIFKVLQVVSGGVERQDSVKNGLEAIGSDYDTVLIHDAVRPFVTEDMIRLTIAETARHGAVSTGVPVKDTVKRIGPDGWITDTLLRDGLWLTQTPQAFQIDLIRQAYLRAYEDRFYATDDAAIVERMGHPVKMVLGSYDNIKITTPEDLVMADFFMKTRGET